VRVKRSRVGKMEWRVRTFRLEAGICEIGGFRFRFANLQLWFLKVLFLFLLLSRAGPHIGVGIEAAVVRGRRVAWDVIATAPFMRLLGRPSPAFNFLAVSSGKIAATLLSGELVTSLAPFPMARCGWS
jgi:hypothetical protein